MPELISDLPYRIVDTQGREFYVSVAGDRRLDGEWEGWLEFVPLDDSEPLLTPTETTQSNRGSLQNWADALQETYVTGAFRRAVPAGTFIARMLARRVVQAAAPPNDVDVPDPFQLFDGGRAAMRARLAALSRPVLLKMIDVFGLNPARKNLSWLTERQLVTFVVTAVEAQIAIAQRSA